MRPLDVSRASDLGSQHTRPAALLQLLFGIAGTEDRAERDNARPSLPEYESTAARASVRIIWLSTWLSLRKEI
ncbi:MAG TPA: hypothetical protein VGN95_14635 [Pyrinomonadaceae bacterium]|nr:hypothetical protein [Pyrinomonadaceae bacterium]